MNAEVRNTEMRWTARSTVLPRVAIALGDPAGIGPEIALKAALDPEVRALCRPVLFGDRRALDAHAKCCGMSVRIESIGQASDIGTNGAGVRLVDSDQFTRKQL